MLTVAVLGPLEVVRDGQRVEVPSGKTTELVVRLAMEAGAPVRADLLLEDLWRVNASAARRNTLQSKITMLRRAVGDPRSVVSRGGGYALAVDPSGVDALQAVNLAARAAAQLDAGQDQQAVDTCAAALRLYRGEPLEAAGDGDWVGPHRAHLDQARLRLVETQYAARLRLGDVQDLVGELEAAVATYPFQESLWEFLITALYRAGRQSDALATYQRVRFKLSDELGLDPTPRLQRLEQRILTHDASLEDPSDGHLAPSRGQAEQAVPAGNLPSLSVELVGREADVARVADLLTTRRLVEIVGPGGVGKTALAIAVGRELLAAGDRVDGGVWLARLEAAKTADEVVDSLISALRGPGSEDALFERLKNTSAVVVLDNCEHVLDAAAALAVRLLDAAPLVRVLCTSQVPLGIEGETIIELTPLALPEAADLFTRRALAHRRGQRSQPDQVAILDLCRALDGLPLAIELAAARTKTLSVGEITRRLDDRFAVLSDPTSRRPERLRALRSTIAWSYDLLFPDDQRGLWALATFAGGALPGAVERVLEALDVPSEATIDVVDRLVSRSLVIVDEEAGSVRYRLLDSIRAFALAALADSGLADRAHAAHADWFAQAATTSTTGVRGAQQAEHLAFASTQRANIDAALTWTSTHDPMLGLRIVNGFGWAWTVLGDSRGAQRILAALETAGDLAPAHERADALLLAAWIEASCGDLSPARRHINEAAQLATSHRDVELEARCCYHLAYVVSHHGDFRHALELTDRSSALYDQLDRPWEQATNALFAARAAISAVDQERSDAAAAEVQRWLRQVEDPWLRVRGEAMLGDLARIQHRFEDAVAHLAHAARTSGQLGFQQTEAYQVMSLGRAQSQAGNPQIGAATLETAVTKAQDVGDVRLAALTRVHLARVLRSCGQADRARTELELAARWHHESGGGELAALGDCLLAALDAADQVPGAEHRLLTALDQARADDDAPTEVFALDALARMAATGGDIPAASALMEGADRRMNAADFVTDHDRVDAHWVRRLNSAPPTAVLGTDR